TAGGLGSSHQPFVELARSLSLGEHVLGRDEGSRQPYRQRVDIGLHDAVQEDGERVPGIALVPDGGLGLIEVDAESVAAELPEKVLLARPAPVQGADADTRSGSDG